MYETMLLVCNHRYSIRSNPVENLFLIISKKNEQTLKLTGSPA